MILWSHRLCLRHIVMADSSGNFGGTQAGQECCLVNLAISQEVQPPLRQNEIRRYHQPTICSQTSCSTDTSFSAIALLLGWDHPGAWAKHVDESRFKLERYWDINLHHSAWAWMLIYVHIHTYIHTLIKLDCITLHLHTYIYVCIYIYIHICMYIYICVL